MSFFWEKCLFYQWVYIIGIGEYILDLMYVFNGECYVFVKVIVLYYLVCCNNGSIIRKVRKKFSFFRDDVI